MAGPQVDITLSVARLRSDNTSGAMALVTQALDILEAFVSQESSAAPATFRGAFSNLIGEIVAAQPCMAIMLNLAQQALQACTSASTLPSAQVQESLKTFRQGLHNSLQRLCQQALGLFPARATVLTYSNSATVIAALSYAQAQQRLHRVLLSESRPACDGRPQALALLQQGVQVEYSVDMALFTRLPEVDLVLVGADAVFPEGLLNKLGTRTLAEMARRYQVPFYSLCTAQKFLPQSARALLRIVEHASAEVWPQAPAGLIVHNAYFDITPLELCRGLVHEDGVTSPEALRRLLQQRTLSPALQQLLAEQVESRGRRQPHGA